jgi:imidazolonepropionase-like amidohydrolase
MEIVRLMVRHLHEAGAVLMTGTDAASRASSPRFTHGLSEFVEAGPTPFEAFRTVTVNPARFLGLDGESGLIAVGSNPLSDEDRSSSINPGSNSIYSTLQK